MLSAALVLLLGSPPTDARAGGEPGGPVSHGGHPDLSEHYSHLAHQDPSHLEHLRAIKAHKAAAGDTIGRLARGSDHWAVHSRLLQGYPKAMMKIESNGERNPEYDR